MKADVAELADALDSKSGGRKAVWVRPPPSAPLKGVYEKVINLCKLFRKSQFEPIVVLEFNKLNISKKLSVK